jgi:hypothetical protein
MIRLLGAALCLFPAQAQDRSRAGFEVWDTGALADAPESGWTRVASGETPEPKGGLVVSNGKLRIAARRKGPGLEVWTLGTGAPFLRATLLPPEAAAVESVALVEHGRASAVLEIGWKGRSAQFRLARGDLHVEVRPGPGATALRVQCASRFVLLPDFFADDLLVDARALPADRAELPSENFLLQPLGSGDVLAMTVFENRDQEVRVTLAGTGPERVVTGSEIEFGKGRKVWVAFLEAPGIWHSRELDAADAKKILPLGWRMPFVAQWRADFTRRDGLTDSWDLLLADRDGDGYIKPSWIDSGGRISEASRTAAGEVDRDAYKAGGPASDRIGPDRIRWTTVLGKVPYPCWTDRERNGFLQPLEHKKLSFQGPVLIYPSNRLADTPLDCFTPVDVVRNTLGVGPCEHLLDVEGQKQEHVGRATCHVRTLLNETYGAGGQKARAKEVEAWLGDGYDFLVHIRNRVLAYVAFGAELRKHLAAQKAARPELAAGIEPLEALAKEIDERVEARLQAIRTHKFLADTVARVVARKEEPTPPALAAELNRIFRERFLGYEGADWKERIKSEYTDALTAIGGQQDEMVGECRWVVKALRQKAGILVASDPRLAAVAAEVRARCQKMLRGGAAYEGARH